LKKDKEEKVDEEELKAIKKKKRIFDFFWNLEEQQTILGLLKGRKMKKKLKDHLKEKEAKNV
tara:strand:- start:528 stop:713 length:186 start_codon:yes stop_codon:yes gene_type:complete